MSTRTRRAKSEPVSPVGGRLGFCVFFGYDYYRNGVKRKIEPQNKTRKDSEVVSGKKRIQRSKGISEIISREVLALFAAMRKEATHLET